ncbi:MAG: lysophospholipid acyltransferase family protein [Deltaproteobacteria bacterium]|nr:lysophospholipid acyltransferase family protein [Deltaproteobacteria bacterium]
MIPESPRPWLGALLRLVLRRRVRRSLSALRVLGLDETRALARRGPLLLCANHVCFWDAGVIEQLTQLLEVDARVLMLASELRKAPFLRWLGCFGVEAGDPRDGARAILHAARLLDRPGRALWLFPQGAQRPQWQRPLAFQRGAEVVASRVEHEAFAVVPVSLHYELGEAEAPEVWVRLGPPATSTPRVADLERSVQQGLDELTQRISAGIPLASQWPSRERLGQGVASRALARLLGAR